MTGYAASYSWIAVACFLFGCRDADRNRIDSTRSLPPVFPASPAENTHWNGDAGPIMIAPVSGSVDSTMVILPYATDSTIDSLQNVATPIAGMTFDLFGRTGKVAANVSALSLPLPQIDTAKDCYSWPAAKLHLNTEIWQFGFVSGRAQAIPLDSIESLSSRDSASLAASITQSAATLPGTVDATFKGLPFRVRSAYTFQLDTMEVVVADIVRSVNEEAKPRVEHLLIFGERAHGSNGKFDVSYFSRNAGAEDSTPVTEVLGAIKVGSARQPIVVVNVQFDEGGKFGFIERSPLGKWSATWRSAYTDC
jgi:hypothetical protein